jgi:hypothetical protein
MSGHQYRTLRSAVRRLRPSAASIAAAAAVQDPGLLLQLHTTLRQSLIDKPVEVQHAGPKPADIRDRINPLHCF